MSQLLESREAYEAFSMAADYVNAQHIVWDKTPILPHVLLDLIEKNIRAMADKVRPEFNEFGMAHTPRPE